MLNLFLSPFFAVVFLLVAFSVCGQPPPSRPYYGGALQAEQWLRTTAFDTLGGRDWRRAPDSSAYYERQSPFLYSGTAGVILFYLELFQTTGNRAYLTEAQRAAERIARAIPDTVPAAAEVGLYTGLAGLAFTFERLYQASGQQKYRWKARKALDRIRRAATPKGEGGITWGEVNEIVYGAAGVGLAFLHAYHHLDYRKGKDLAFRTGMGLLATAIPADGGLRWPWAPELADRNYPNFAHGTAGVAYFLAALYQTTGNQCFLDAARAGADYLEAHTAPSGLLFRHSPGAEDVFYLGWCHGIAGTGRLYYKLYQITGEKKWLDKICRAADYVRTCGIPQQPTAGFWNNVGQCCGSAGLAQFFLDLYQLTDRTGYLDFARILTDDLLRRAAPAGDGLKWVHAENRSQPDWVMAQTGFMQGAAGIGVWLLHLDAFERGAAPFIRLPDDPWEDRKP